MRFIAVDRIAATEIISDRRFQSLEYDAGRALAQLLQNPALEAKLTPQLTTFRHVDGLFLLSNVDRSRDFVIFDETCALFSPAHTLEDELLYLHKVLRFATKIWENLRLSVTEHVIPNSSKAVVFPNPISQRTGFRISIELAPDSERRAKREQDGRSLLVYRSGVDEGGGSHEAVSVTNFRRFLDARRSLPAVKTHGSDSVVNPSITALKVTSLHGLPSSQIHPFQGYERWMEFLTAKQKEFVTAELIAPHRIEGPAGTGKTLCLILKAIAGLRAAQDRQPEHAALFIAHSESTKRTIQQLVEYNDPWRFLTAEEELRPHTLKLTTLQQLCSELLLRKIYENEFLDRDAMESKQLQLLYVHEALRASMAQDYSTHKRFLSKGFDEFLSNTDDWAIAEMLQHEIGVVIKGRAEEQLENYRSLPRLRYGLPVETDADRGFVFVVFGRYRRQLETAAQFDTDDIVLSTIGQLDTPLWRRRRAKEGYDSIYIDETHLFNINELSLFHHLTRHIDSYPIAYSVDKAQAMGDRGWTDQLFEEALSPSVESRKMAARTEVRGIFRCSPHIVNFAFSVTSSGATLFTNFEDPLKMALSMFTPEEERKCAVPRLLASANDADMISRAFVCAEEMVKELDASRCDVVLGAFTDDLFKQAQGYAQEHNKPTELLKERGDIDAVRRARQAKRFVLSTPDYIGGLEFDGAVLIGVDEGRVPPSRTLSSVDSVNYLSYTSHNRLYVAITRARYRAEVLITTERGPSPLLRTALTSGFLLEDPASKKA